MRDRGLDGRAAIREVDRIAVIHLYSADHQRGFIRAVVRVHRSERHVRATLDADTVPVHDRLNMCL